MEKILIVDDDIKVIKFLKNLISQKMHLEYASATSKKSLIELLKEPTEYAVAIVSTKLAQAPYGSCIDLVLEKDIALIAMVSGTDEKTSEVAKTKDILEYIDKEKQSSFSYVVRLVQFIHNFKGSKILIVDDMKTSRLQVRFALEKLKLDIYEAENGEEALAIIKSSPDIQLIITDQNMPIMSGVELTTKIRETYCLNELSVIGISASNDISMSVDFLKHGANDFIKKPFSSEELLSRVISSLEMQYYVKLAEESSVRDYLTGLHNRKYLYETGLKIYENARREHLSIVIAMLDIDYFKKINDRYGHEIGDLALKKLATLLKKSFRDSDILTRYGGEEFCVILTNTDIKKAVDVMNNLRIKTEEMLIESNNISFRMTLSIGVTDKISTSFSEMINVADENLYKAKNDGRNKIVH